jgi:hypothetical protein
MAVGGGGMTPGQRNWLVRALQAAQFELDETNKKCLTSGQAPDTNQAPANATASAAIAAAILALQTGNLAWPGDGQVTAVETATATLQGLRIPCTNKAAVINACQALIRALSALGLGI